MSPHPHKPSTLVRSKATAASQGGRRCFQGKRCELPGSHGLAISATAPKNEAARSPTPAGKRNPARGDGSRCQRRTEWSRFQDSPTDRTPCRSRRTDAPESPEIRLGLRLGACVLLPVTACDSIHDGHCHLDELVSQFTEGAHAAHGEGEELVFGERLDDSAGKPAMSLPVLQNILGAQCAYCQCLGYHIKPPCGPLGHESHSRYNSRQNLS